MKRLFTKFLFVFLCAATVIAAVAWSQTATAPEPARPREGCLLLNIPVVVDLNNEKNKETIEHERRAVASGSPRILHLERDQANDRRRASLSGIPTRTGFDRDEYPPAASIEGGSSADVAYIDPTDNRSAGSLMGLKLRPFCDGQAFILEP